MGRINIGSVQRKIITEYVLNPGVSFGSAVRFVWDLYNDLLQGDGVDCFNKALGEAVRGGYLTERREGLGASNPRPVEPASRLEQGALNL
jgi:hypothetical protein